jgi:trehalose 6-phosphate phosphatase
VITVPDASLTRLIAPLRDAPRDAALLFDVDGTLAPIVRDPGDAAVPSETRGALLELARRFALVACISGRRADEARRLVGIDELAYAGNHGLEILLPGGREPELDPAIADAARVAREFAVSLGTEAVGGSGLRLEDKGPIQAFHWRGAADEAAAEGRAREIAERAQRAGLEPRWGRKVLELRPVSGVDKGTAVRRLLADRGLSLALFAGDDRTDLDAFAALRSLAEAGELRSAVCLGIVSAEAPPELEERSDAVLGSPHALVEVLRRLASGSRSPSRPAS